MMPTMSIWLLSADVLAQAPAEVRDLEAAKAAWQKRHDLIHSVRVTLAEDEITHLAFFQLASKIAGGNEAIPDQDVHDSFRSVVTIKGDNFKYAYTGKLWTPVTKKQEPIDYIAISTSSVRSFFFDNSAHAGGRPQLSRSNRLSESDELLLKLIPFMLAVRSGQPHHRKLADYTQTGQMVAVEGRDCVEFLGGSQHGKAEYIYLDPKRDWVVCRIDGYKEGKLIRRITAEYNAERVVGWLPSNWSYVTRSPNGAAISSGKVTVAKYEINVEIPDDEFTPKYPPGTFVVDDMYGTGKETVSIIKQDGSAGVALPLSKRPTDEQLLLANEPPKRRTWRYWLLGGSVLVLGLVTLLWYRRRGRTTDSSAAGGAAGAAPMV